MFEQIDQPLILALVERWQPDTNTFRMMFEEMTITLHSVKLILGIRAYGIAVDHGLHKEGNKNLIIQQTKLVVEKNLEKSGTDFKKYKTAAESFRVSRI